jgi:uncharacterized tellurite resistance protein B-like protein
VLDALKSLLAGRSGSAPGVPAPAPRPAALEVAACALLLEVAHADREFTDDERRHIEEVVIRHFDLDPESARQLMGVAEEARRESVDLHQFTAVIARHYDEGQRMLLAELVWRIVHADGKLSEHESHLARKLANLLELRPGYLAEARRRALGGPAAEAAGEG